MSLLQVGSKRGEGYTILGGILLPVDARFL